MSPPLSENDIFPPLAIRFELKLFPLCLSSFLFCIYFTLLLYNCFPLASFLSCFFLFLKHLRPFSLPLFHIFFPNDVGQYSSPGSGGIFQYIDPCCTHSCSYDMPLASFTGMCSCSCFSIAGGELFLELAKCVLLFPAGGAHIILFPKVSNWRHRVFLVPDDSAAFLVADTVIYIR